MGNYHIAGEWLCYGGTKFTPLAGWETRQGFHGRQNRVALPFPFLISIQIHDGESILQYSDMSAGRETIDV